MAKYRKLSRTSSQRKALIRGQVTALIANGKIVTTEAKAKEIRKVAEGLIAAAVREKDNFDEVTVTAKVARKDADGKRVKEVVDGKKVTVYDEVEKKIKKDQPSRLHARREMLKVLYTVKTNDGTKKGTKEVDLVAKKFGFCLNCRGKNCIQEVNQLEEIMKEQIAKWKSESLPDIEIDILRVLYNNRQHEMSAVEIGNEVDRHHLAITKIMEKLSKRDYVSYVTRDKRYYSIKEKAISIFFNDVMETVENENS